MFPSRDYDEAITIFSPEGRLYQVEYALELVKKGAPIIGLIYKEGIVLAANETLESILEDPKVFKKIFQLDQHLGVAIAGHSSDARVLIYQARLICQQNRLLYDEPVNIEYLATRIGDLLQTYTQYGGIRPFGVSVLFAGVDNLGSRVLSVDPSGSYRGYRAVALGRKSEETNKMLMERYKEDMNLGEAVALAVEAVKTASEGEVKVRLKVAVIPKDTRTFRRLTEDEFQNT